METPKAFKNASLTVLIICLLWAFPMKSSAQNNKLLVYDPKVMRERYEGWMRKHDRDYKSRGEFECRYGIYRSNVMIIDLINSLNLSYKLIDNNFADLTNEEFRDTYLGYVRSRRHPQTSIEYDNITEVPSSVDWRKKGAVTPIKDQGQCGSCWAFSAVAAVEGINKIKKGKLISLSEQELVDCDVSSGNQGCNGGYMEKAFEFIKKNDGITTENNYPYRGFQDTCNKNKEKNHAVTVSGYKRVHTNDEKSLQVAVANQPVSVGIDAGSHDFQLYSEGIFSGRCGTALNHGVAVVGYGGAGDRKYWVVKNSWGTGWGENGYIRMKRDIVDREGTCGIAMQASYPIKA